MNNIIDYVKWRSDLTFNKDSFNILDVLIFSQISYIDFDISVSKFPCNNKNSISKAINEIFDKVKKEDIVLGLILPNEILQLADEIKDTIRYKDIEISNYVNIVDNSISCQFSALTVHLDSKNILICYRGTDDTLIGWKEDVDMICKFPLPSQKLACDYLEKIAEMYEDCNIYLTGHSKGGNLANYAAIYCKDIIKEKIKQVYCFDSPGFEYQINQRKFELVKDKIVSIVPQCSVIGLAFKPYYGRQIVTMAYKKGIRQHDAFTWQVCGKDFVLSSEINKNAKRFIETAKGLLEKLSHVERNELADDLYSFIISSNKNTLVESSKDPMILLKYFNKTSAKSKKVIMELIINFTKNKLL